LVMICVILVNTPTHTAYY